jgi:hypothetical protein
MNFDMVAGGWPEEPEPFCAGGGVVLGPCLACGFLVHDDVGYGSYLICPVCGWEDCAIQLANPLDGGGPNRRSLVDCQAEAVRRWPLPLTATGDDGERYTRDPEWRPLSPEEIAFYAQKASEGVAYRPSRCYWVESPLSGGGEPV